MCTGGGTKLASAIVQPCGPIQFWVRRNSPGVLSDPDRFAAVLREPDASAGSTAAALRPRTAGRAPVGRAVAARDLQWLPRSTASRGGLGGEWRQPFGRCRVDRALAFDPDVRLVMKASDARRRGAVDRP